MGCMVNERLAMTIHPHNERKTERRSHETESKAPNFIRFIKNFFILELEIYELLLSTPKHDDGNTENNINHIPNPSMIAYAL